MERKPIEKIRGKEESLRQKGGEGKEEEEKAEERRTIGTETSKN